VLISIALRQGSHFKFAAVASWQRVGDLMARNLNLIPPAPEAQHIPPAPEAHNHVK